ncbi:hypothetical protein LCGC14_1762810 [marine sediment metagenome]|uniref:Uncharacterized protein n=1 Tax=marine sediment metagenome TaxID=412755 RepID=A0A0F9H0L1_9ZZZZ
MFIDEQIARYSEEACRTHDGAVHAVRLLSGILLAITHIETHDEEYHHGGEVFSEDAQAIMEERIPKVE